MTRTMDILSKQLGDKLLEKGLLISAAESCTGGLVCQMITDVAGSSQWFERGFISYTNEAKNSMLNVPKEVIAKYGAVSIETVEAMAKGAIKNSLADISLAVSGIAGPSGGTPSKPVGTVCFAWANKQGKIQSEVKLFAGDRGEVRQQAANYSLAVVLRDFL